MTDGGKVTTATLKERKQRGERIAALTAYDHLFATLLDRAGIDVLLVGDRDAVVHVLSEAAPPSSRFSVVHAEQVVEMDESPAAALRRKQESSLNVAFELVRDGQGDAVVTMGNSGAAMAMGMVRERPTVATEGEVSSTARAHR